MNHLNDLIASAYLRGSLLSETTLISVAEVLLRPAETDSACLLVSRGESDRTQERVELPSELSQAAQKVGPLTLALGPLSLNIPLDILRLA
jgi:hypothetical protein